MRKWILASAFIGILNIVAATAARADLKCIGPGSSEASCEALGAEHCYDVAVATCLERGGVEYYNCSPCGYYEHPMFNETVTTDETCPGEGQGDGWYMILEFGCNGDAK